MTLENQFTPSEEQPLPSEEKGFVRSDSDLFLMTLVHIFNSASIEVGITLFVQGTVISGILISEQQYFEGVSNELKATDLFSSEAASDAINAFINSFKPPTNSSDDIVEENTLENRQFIHLKNASIQSGNSLISFTRTVYWRGRLSRVDGFFLGNSQM